MISNIPKEDRPREKLLKKGSSSLTDAELLAIFLRTGIKGKSAIELSQSIIDKYLTLNGLSNISANELSKIKGLGLAKSAQLVAAFELGKRLSIEKIAGFIINDAQSVYDLLALEMQSLSKEVLKIILLNSKNRILKIDNISIGTLTESLAHPRDIFRPAIVLSASGFILVHNHPSGDPSPSKSDIEITKDVAKLSKVFKINFLDHIIIGHQSQSYNPFYSFLENGCL